MTIFGTHVRVQQRRGAFGAQLSPRYAIHLRRMRVVVEMPRGKQEDDRFVEPYLLVDGI